jgi:hypothetical protein
MLRKIWAFALILDLLYLKRFSEARIGVTELKNIFPIEWLHIQKTGSTFGNVLLRWACDVDEQNVVVPGGGFRIPEHCEHLFRKRKGTRKNWPIGDHFPLPTNASLSCIRHVVTMVRSPLQQMVSHYYHSHGKGPICDFVQKKIGFGHQTKFIAGKSKDDTSCQDACFRLNQFAFFGIADFWHASMCLFHKELGGLDTISDSQILRLGKYNHSAFSDPTPLSNCHNSKDECMFQCGLDIYLAKISKTACAFLLRPVNLGSEMANNKLKLTLNFLEGVE